MKPQLSLKGRALQLLAQREHSRIELRRKLLRRLRDDRVDADVSPENRTPVRTLADLHAEVDAVLDWLQAHRYLSDERFVESRVHARSSRFGNLRIRQELSQHGVTLTPTLSGDLRDSEKARAIDVQQRKFGGPPASLSERARQARFLAGRGFSSEVVWQVLREACERSTDRSATNRDPDASSLQWNDQHEEAD
jgi:regulatory protein